MVFSFVTNPKIRIVRQFHAVTAMRYVPTCHHVIPICERWEKNWKIFGKSFGRKKNSA
ncbi:MAG: hypothetical protein LBC02_04105 [Planctomycetaceae bacterium]|nr:hypothetical protein [Planctomycetaceae bacterium]